MSKAIENIKKKAEELAEVRRLINEIEEVAKEKVDALKAKREALQTELILGFNKEGLSSIKTDDGSIYSKSIRKGLEVVDERAALAWAVMNHAVSINKVLAKQRLENAMKRKEDLPDGFEYKEVEYISVRSPKAAEDEAKKE